MKAALDRDVRSRAASIIEELLQRYAMSIQEIQASVKYVTNAAGEKTDVIVPVKLWEELLNFLKPDTSGLDPIDENEPNAQILADLQEAIRQGRAGETYPISELWNGIDV